MALHEQAVGKSCEWYTPGYVFDALGCHFDLDVASPGADVVPWIPATRHLTKTDSPLWRGFIWMNPPFGERNGLSGWLSAFERHGNGIALVPDRTSAVWWQWIAKRADKLLFVAPKIRFLRPDGKPGRDPAQGTTLVAIGTEAEKAIIRAAAAGLGFLAARLA